VKNPEDAEEVAQDVLLKVYRKIDAFRGDAALSSWIYRITFNTVMSRLRGQKAMQHHEVREADLLVHIVDISHPDFEDQITVVNQTLAEIGAHDKPTILLFNKIDAYKHVERDPYDLGPLLKENLTLEDLKNTWMAKEHNPTLFISAVEKTNIEEFKNVLYDEAKKIHIRIYPYNNFLY